MFNEYAYVINVKIAINRGRAMHCLHLANRDVGKSVPVKMCVGEGNPVGQIDTGGA
jgi:hypothetical protein